MAHPEVSEEPAEPSPGRSWRGKAKIVGGVVLIAVIGFGIWKVGGEAGAYLERFAGWIESLGFWGPLVFILGYAIATVAFIPGSLLTLAAGAIFGLVTGTVYVFFGATLGATGAFLIARYLARSAIERQLAKYPRFAAVDRAVGTEGRKIVFLLRLSPVFPFVYLNYGLGLTRVRLADYLVASLGMIPGTLLYVYLGKAVGDLTLLFSGATTDKGWAGYGVLVLGLVATAVVTTLVTRLARKALRDATEGATHQTDDGTPGT